MAAPSSPSFDGSFRRASFDGSVPSQTGTTRRTEPIFVAVRVRPFVPREEGQDRCVEVRDHSVILRSELGRSDEFSFDGAFDNSASQSTSDSSQAQIYSIVGTRLRDRALEGFNAAVFAYGHTGTGKTTTIFGNPSSSEGIGLVPRLLSDLFDEATRLRQEGRHVRLRVRIFEVYNERVKDMLAPIPQDPTATPSNGSGQRRQRRTSLDVRAHPSAGVYVPGLTEVDVTTCEEATNLLYSKSQLRSTASTAMNDRSSRGHLIFALTFDRGAELGVLPDEESPCVAQARISDIYCVDLAGRENERTTLATGDRLVELSFINRSLFHLSSCISGLQQTPKARTPNRGRSVSGNVSSSNQTGGGTSPMRRRSSDPSPRPQGIAPFRNSRLTLLLSEAISGNSCTAMISTVSPAWSSRDETLNTLQFASSVRNIRLEATRGIASRKDVVTSLQEEVLQLREQLSLVRNQLGSAPPQGSYLQRSEVPGDTGSPIAYGPFFLPAEDNEVTGGTGSPSNVEANAQKEALASVEALIGERDLAHNKIDELQEKLRKSEEEAQELKAKVFHAEAASAAREASLAEREAIFNQREAEIHDLMFRNKALKKGNEKLLQREACLMQENKLLTERISQLDQNAMAGMMDSSPTQQATQIRRCMDLANMNHQLLQDLYVSRACLVAKEGGFVSDRSTDASGLGSHDHSGLGSPLTSSSSSFVSSQEPFYQAEDDRVVSPWLRSAITQCTHRD